MIPLLPYLNKKSSRAGRTGGEQLHGSPRGAGAAPIPSQQRPAASAARRSAKRTLAALAALLVAASTLTVVAAQPAAAHGVTVRRCAYDPFAGNQCWNETSFNHYHTPVQRNLKCGDGMLGTYPNCYPAPSTNENDDPNADKDDDGSDDGGGGSGDNPDPDSTGDDDSTDPDSTGDDDSTDPDTDSDSDADTDSDSDPVDDDSGGAGTDTTPTVCPAGETGTPPTCVKKTTTQQAQCATNNHRHAVGGTCHPDHEPPCGVGKWDPGHGHERVDRPACTYSDASHATGPVTYCGSQSHTHKTRHFHYGGNGCHPVADEHTTRTSYDTCSDWVDALIAAIKTNSTPLPARPASCPAMTAAEIAEVVRNAAARFGSGIANALKKVMEYQGEAGLATSEGYAELGKEIEELWDKTPEGAKQFIKGLTSAAACIALGKAIAATTAATGGAAAPAWIAWIAAHKSAKVGGALVCGGAVNYAMHVVSNWGNDDDSNDDSDNDDSDNGSDSGSDSGGSDSGGGYGGSDPDDLDGDGDFDNDDVNEAARRMARGDLDPDEYIRLYRRNQCSKPGHCE